MNKNFGKTLVVTFSIDESEAGRLQAVGIELGAVIEGIGLRQDIAYTKNRPALLTYNGPAPKKKGKHGQKGSNAGANETIKKLFTDNIDKVVTGMQMREALGKAGFDRDISGSIVTNLLKQNLIRRVERSRYTWVVQPHDSGGQALAMAGPKSTTPKTPTEYLGEFLAKFKSGETFGLPEVSDFFLEKDVATTKIGGALAHSSRNKQIKKLAHGKYEVV